MRPGVTAARLQRLPTGAAGCGEAVSADRGGVAAGGGGGEHQPAAGQLCPPTTATVQAAAAVQDRVDERLSELDGHDVVEDRIDDRTDVVQHAGDVEEDQIADAVRVLVILVVNDGGRRRVVHVSLGSCGGGGGGGGGCAVGVRRHESLSMKRSPADEECHDDGHCAHTNTYRVVPRCDRNSDFYYKQTRSQRPLYTVSQKSATFHDNLGKRGPIFIILHW